MFSVGDITRTKTIEELNSSAFVFHSLEVNSRFKNIDEIADRYCTVVDVNDEEKIISVMLDDGFEAQLPWYAFVGVIAEESLHSKNEIEGNSEYALNIDDGERYGSEVVKNFAAQCIQTAFRRYLDCKPAIRIRKINSTQRLVQDMAAATIINGLRRSMEKKRNRKLLQKSGLKSWSNDNLLKRYPSVIISDVKTLNLPIVLLGNSQELSIKFMIMNKFSKTPTGVDPPPCWQSEMSGKVISGKEVKWPNLSLVAPVILEELEINPNYQLILRLNFYDNNLDLMGFCECNLLSIYDELAAKDTATSEPKRAKKAVSRLLTMNTSIPTNSSGGKPVVAFLICLESPPPPSYRCRNYQNDSVVGDKSRKVLRNSFISSDEILNLQSSSTVDYPTKDIPPISAPIVSSIISIKADTSKQSNTANSTAPQLVGEKPPTRVKNTTKFEKLKHKRSEPEEEKKLKSNDNDKALKRSLFDEIFALVVRKYAAVITVGVKDLCIILDALDVPVKEDILQNNPTFRMDGLSTSTSHQDAHIQLPLSNAATLAATLSLETVQRNILVDSSGVAGARRNKGDNSIITEKLAEIARNELLNLIRGNFDKCKEIILKFCAVTTDGSTSGRPSEWSSRQVMQFISSMGIESRKFSNVSGKDFLKVRLEDSALRDFDIHQPILQKRFAIYRQTILYIDKWWDHGLRPNNLFSSGELKQIAMNNFERKSKRDGLTEFGRRTSDANTTEVGSSIKIAEFDDLLRELVRFNRAYGWSLSPGLMTNICAQVAGRNASIISYESRGEDSSNGRNSTINSGRSNSEISSELKYLNDSGSHPPQQYYAYTGQQQPLTEVKGCKWVRLAFSSNEINPSLENSIIWRCESSFLEQNLSLKSDFPERALEVCECFALLPAICCRKPSGKDKHLLEVIDDLHSNKNSTSESKANSLLIAAKVQVGMIASIVDYSTLIRLYQRFDWWDQPSYDFLRAVAGSNVQVVSVAGLNSSVRDRIGVQCLDSDLCDAVPVEAILSLMPQDEYVAPAVKAEKKASKKRLPSSTHGKKGKLSRSKGFKGGSTNVSGRTAKTSASESIDNEIDMRKCKLVEASMLSNLSSVIDQPELVQPAAPVVQIVDRRNSHGTEGGERPLSRVSSSILTQHLASVPSKAIVVDTSRPEESPSNDLIIPDSPRNYAWLKLVAKSNDPNKDAEVTAVGNLEPKYVSRKRREFSYPTLNLAFEPNSPVQLPSKTRKEKLQENNRNTNGAKSRTANYQCVDQVGDSEDDMEMEFVTFVKSPPSGKKVNSNNNDSNGTNVVRPKSAPSIPKQRTMVNTPGLHGLNAMGGKIATDFNAVQATEVDLVSNIVVNTPPQRQQQSNKVVNKFVENNKIESARFVELKTQTFDDSDVLRVGVVSGGGGGDFSRPSSAGTVRPRRPKAHSSLLDPSGQKSPDPTIVKESLNGANFKLGRQFTETEKNVSADSNSAKNRPRRPNPRNNSKVNQWSQQGDQDREDALRKREMSLSEREASFKESYLRRQLKRLGVGTGET